MHLFYHSDLHQNILKGEEALHCTKVMRMQVGDEFKITDGKGKIFTCEIGSFNKSEVAYKVTGTQENIKRPYSIRMFIAPTRKAERNEWMVEKMVELGIDEIHFFKSEHTHSESFKRVTNPERLTRIAIAAMKQSYQAFLPEIYIHDSIDPVLELAKDSDRFIAYVTEERESPHLSLLINKNSSSCILIGPEGDFSEDEIKTAIDKGFQPVSLGKTRLRTETAAIIACHCVHLGDQYATNP